MLWYGAGQVGKGMVALGLLSPLSNTYRNSSFLGASSATKYTTMQSAMTAVEPVFQLLDSPVTIASPAQPHQPAQVQGLYLRPRVFAYKGEDWVLRDVSFSVAPGEKIALVGATGAGKTTISKLLNRFYEVQRGAILVDGVDVRQGSADFAPPYWRIIQDVFFSLAIGDECPLGREEISPRGGRACAAMSTLTVCPRLPRGYGTMRERARTVGGATPTALVRARTRL